MMDVPKTIGIFRVVRQLPSSATHDAYVAEGAAGTTVVLKVFDAPVRNQGLLDPKVADEVSAYARLAHPNIVKVVDLFSADGRFVLALEYVEGVTLESALATLRRNGTAPDDVCWFYVASCVFAALASAHAAKGADGAPAPILHRNVNPSCIFLSYGGEVKLGDFSLVNAARRLSNPSGDTSLAGVAYQAPEQAKLEEVTTRADVYSATLVLWELLAGRAAFDRSVLTDVDLLRAIAEPHIAPLERIRPTVNARVLRAIHEGLEPDAAKRPMRAAHLRDVLVAAINVGAARQALVDALGRGKHGAAETVAETLRALSVHHAPPVVPPSPEEVVLEASDIQTVRPPPLHQTVKLPPAALAPPPLPVAIASPEQPTPFATTAAPSISPKARSNGVRFAVGGAIALAACVAVVGLLLHRSPGADASRPPEMVVLPTATVSPPATSSPPVESATAEPPPPPVAASTTAPAQPPPSASSAPSESSAPSDIPGDVGELVFPAYAAGHRIYFDGRVVGDGASPIRVACGRHTLRIGSAGRTQSVDVPCGEQLELK
jgi:serine/threonine-protein kinase